MVVDLIKWISPPKSRDFEASIRVRYLKGAKSTECDRDDHSRPSSSSGGRSPRLTVEIRWKGSRRNGLMALSKKAKSNNYTREEAVNQNGVVVWDEKFKSKCSFSGSGNNDDLNPWEVAFIVLKSSNQEQNNKLVYAGPAVLNLAKYASVDGEQELEISVPLTQSSSVEWFLTLYSTLHLRELRTNQEPSRTFQRSSTSMPLSAPLSPCFRVPATLEDNESPTQEISLRRTRSLKDFVSFSRRKSKKAHRIEAISESSEENCTFYKYSLDYNNKALSEDNKEFSDNVDQNSLGYGDLSTANLAGKMFTLKRSCKDEDLVYNNNNKPKADSLYIDDMPDLTLKLSPKLGKLKSKMSLKAEKVIKGDPLLKKEYGEMGGDDLDFIRWQLNSSDDLTIRGCKTNSLMISEFGDDRFTVGRWEHIEVVSRDGSLKLQTQVFFATIDQRSEKAAGESACTALVVVLTHWLHSNRNRMPIKSELDTLILEGSLQWRKLCEDSSFLARFPDKHFDLETVIQAKICPTPIYVVSTTGFFHPEGMEEHEDIFGFLDGTTSFDCIWDEINEISKIESKPLIYIVSWNDHFFVLKVDDDAFYVIDTLGERLMEGCDRAYVLKFEKDTVILRGGETEEEDSTVVCRGKKACKEYIKSFLAAIPIRELQYDIKEGRKRSKPLHELLQIDIYHTRSS